MTRPHLTLKNFASHSVLYRIPLRSPDGVPMVTLGLRGSFDGLDRERALLKSQRAVEGSARAVMSDCGPEGSDRPFVRVEAQDGRVVALGPVVVSGGEPLPRAGRRVGGR